jgi:RNA polymerase sigma-70 factor (ECF subfamily)
VAPTFEEEIRALLETGKHRAAAARAVATYGPEVLGFLTALLHDEPSAREVFSQACEDVCAGLARFEGRSSVRTWFYAIARNAAARHRRSLRRRGPHASISGFDDLAAPVPSTRRPYLRTEMKAWFAGVRNRLSEPDRALLVLRVDRKLPWSEIARVFARSNASEEALARKAASLRKRFERLKDEIRSRARTDGLVEDADE